jgi:dynamin 1-like protein
MDLVNSDSLKLARQVDPEGKSADKKGRAYDGMGVDWLVSILSIGKRTIGVLTKLDLMDAGTNALDVLTGRSYPLKLGFIGIVNRSQQDILTNKPMADALKAENDFFRQHSSYRAIATRCGTQYLSKQLNQILFNHIKDKLPELRTKLSSLISQTQHDLAQYGDPALTTGTMHRVKDTRGGTSKRHMI